MAQRRAVALLASWSAVFGCLFWRFAPIGEPASAFSSDSAIPVIMANAAQLTTFELYYYGQDRFGSLTSSIGWLVHGLLQRPWTARDAFVLNALILSLGVATLCVVAFRDRERPFTTPVVAALLCGALLCRAESIAPWVVSVAQPYGAGIGVACMAIALFARDTVAGVRRRPLALLALSFLACWVSPLSLPMLALACVPIGAGHDKGQRLRGLARHVSLILLGFAIERAVHYIFLQHVATTYAAEFRVETPAAIEVMRIPESLGMLWQTVDRNLPRDEWVRLSPALLAVGAIVSRPLVRRLSGERRGLFEIVVCASVAAALGNLVGVALAEWTRLNLYPFRYLVPTLVLTNIAAAIATTYVVMSLAHRFRASQAAVSLAAIAVLTVLIRLNVPRQNANAVRELEQTAHRLASIRAPAVVFGSYWGSYVWQGLNPFVLAVPMDGQHSRTPNTRVELANHRTAYLCVDGQIAPPELHQFQTDWTRTKRPPLEADRCRFFEYRRAP